MVSGMDTNLFTTGLLGQRLRSIALPRHSYSTDDAVTMVEEGSFSVVDSSSSSDEVQG